jgi:hypothetical protein
MLRALVLLFLLINGALFAWLHSEPHALQPDREPQRLARQVAPDAIQVLPDLPSPAGAHGAAAAPGAASSASSAEVAASVAVVQAPEGASFPRKTSEADLDCAESGVLDDAQIASLRQALTKAGVPPDALAERRQSQGGAWMVYIGRFADSQTWQRKADELKRLDIGFERVNAPTALAPGLSLGHYPTAAEAGRRLDELGQHGVHSARVVTLSPPVIQRHLQVRATDPAWRHVTGAQHFTSCPIEASTHL